MVNPSIQNIAGYTDLLTGQSSAITAAINAHVALSNPHSQYQLTSQKGNAGGYQAIDAQGRLSSTTGLHNNATPPSGVVSQFIASGTYTPSLTVVANISTATAYKAQWIRVGNVVNVVGHVDAQPTLAVTATSVGISFPLATAISTPSDCAGVAASPTIATQSAAITGSTTASIALMNWKSGDITNQPMHYSFQYEMLTT